MRGGSRAVVTVALTLAVCGSARAQGSLRQAVSSQPYFPLRVGDSWTYQRTGPGGSSEWQVTVSDKQSPPRSLAYYVLSGYFPGLAHAVRSDPFGTVTELSSGYRDFLWYLLGAPEGTSWTIQLPPSPSASPLPGCVSGAKLTLASRDESVQVPAGSFTHVLRVDWSAPCVDAGFTSEWFAPGVGLIRRDETSIAGAVSSVLLHAELGGLALPRRGYTTSLSLERPLLVNNLMPPLGPSSLPTLSGAFSVESRSDAPVTFSFAGCKSVSVAVESEAGETVLTGAGDDGGCCSCASVVEWDSRSGALLIPLQLTLAKGNGEPLPDGRYAVSVMLNSRDAASLRPAARATIDVTSTH
jgi:hypothetical protein